MRTVDANPTERRVRLVLKRASLITFLMPSAGSTPTMVFIRLLREHMKDVHAIGHRWEIVREKRVYCGITYSTSSDEPFRQNAFGEANRDCSVLFATTSPSGSSFSL